LRFGNIRGVFLYIRIVIVGRDEFGKWGIPCAD